MIAVDSSALMAIVLDEPEADACIAALEAEDRLLISAGTVAEALIVSARRNVGEEVASLIDGLGFDIVTVTPASARRIADAYARWGKGRHPAALNVGDCFAYEVAKEHACPLLFIGGDFTKTDIEGALQSTIRSTL
jgi:ribonuclease VapC